MDNQHLADPRLLEAIEYDEDDNEILVTPTSMDTFAVMAEAHAKRLSVPRTGAFSRKQVIEAFADSFELIGGIPRLAAWGHEHPTEFFKLYAKLLPSSATKEVEHKGKVVIEHALQPGALDTMPTHMDGHLIEHTPIPEDPG